MPVGAGRVSATTVRLSTQVVFCGATPPRVAADPMLPPRRLFGQSNVAATVAVDSVTLELGTGAGALGMSSVEECNPEVTNGVPHKVTQLDQNVPRAFSDPKPKQISADGLMVKSVPPEGLVATGSRRKL